MAGRITASEKQLQPDPRYGDRVLAKFINCVMLDGKKAVAQRVVYDAIDKIQARIDKDKREGMPEKAIDAFRQAIDNVKPNVEVRSKRVGGANYQVPMPVTQRRRQSLAFRWIITAIRSEKGKPLSTRLAKELYDAANGEGKACTVREQTHRMAEANKAFSHFAW
ncbi:MAG: 30S ribosomal protein S7 [Phycisphaerales bacterium]|jgi:small subunit ribosomal protein S7|nr:30S ribosomal protein S7 [Planctomycetaceae bacterium]MDP6157315.1 30S ribosomal protein S7 [Phycisphaerales bacterium]MDP6310535.1 30S ribosomal protein S7 [Phycisphaerales bacterium]MDP7087416.1 30S ribosomal protein S7 [Phycisphaerales bacterium]MDP7188515.1 30S ribosomal protein S7 [Phycisphaerales bacterium]|tara:strand:+ start:9783 stop:10277 length:495 start_codon:yes stop_codon:yes gene_type:complete